MRLILGIDPGKYGALAWLDPERGTVVVEDIPMHNGEMDGYALAAWIDAKQPETRIAWIERVTVWKTDGAKGAATFNRTYGEIRGVIMANMIPLADVSPKTWRKHEGIVTAGKSASIEKATEYWGGSWRRPGAGGGRSDRAEAALIARYGWMHTK